MCAVCVSARGCSERERERERERESAPNRLMPLLLFSQPVQHTTTREEKKRWILLVLPRMERSKWDRFVEISCVYRLLSLVSGDFFFSDLIYSLLMYLYISPPFWRLIIFWIIVYIFILARARLAHIRFVDDDWFGGRERMIALI